MALYFLSGLTINVWNAILVQFQTKNKDIHKGIEFDTIERKISIFQFINQEASIIK